MRHNVPKAIRRHDQKLIVGLEVNDFDVRLHRHEIGFALVVRVFVVDVSEGSRDAQLSQHSPIADVPS